MAGVGHRPGGDPLRAARPVVATAWCVAVAGATIAITHPLVLAALVLAVLAVGARAGAGAVQRRALLLGLPLALLVVLVNGLVVRDGLTVLARLGHLPVLGQVDVTLEALVSGGTLALRLLVLLPLSLLFLVAVDPDALLRALRPRWPTAALTAALALRVVPVLARDGRRMADARALRPPGTPGAHDDRAARALVARAVVGSALDRAGDLAAAIELRGHGLGVRPTAPAAPWSRHDRALTAATALLVVTVIAALATGALRMTALPELELPFGGAALALGGLLVVLALVPAVLPGTGVRPPAAGPAGARRPLVDPPVERPDEPGGDR
ncbi:CbiQ family ECF transporter T component [Patulibacter brassicae]|uniref:CbiQ family ECF transporter T component n=1 Tax=Patulibacter brassicae TaxID=1705717 RepID=A0ABU4VG69_9ACTN|nr:CbiQ family ECF transporter T component [Patulibacter brassicae]MDX8150808.1 CbiQ family ECF transporter T component [Patulibacter brassicae]